MIDREAFVSRLILEADTELERGAAYWLRVDAVELRNLSEDLAKAMPMTIEEAGEVLKREVDGHTGLRFGPQDLPLGFDLSEVPDLRQSPWSPWLKPDQTETTAAVVASAENLEQMMAELARLRAIVRDLAASRGTAMTPTPYSKAVGLMNQSANRRGHWEVGDTQAMLAWVGCITGAPVALPKPEMVDVGGGPMPSSKVGVLFGQDVHHNSDLQWCTLRWVPNNGPTAEMYLFTGQQP